MRPRIFPLLLAAALAVNARAQERPMTPAELGRHLVARFGCAGCHENAGQAVGTAREAGSDLRRIAAKTTPGWALEWVIAPRRLRPSTSMPHFFGEDERDEARAVVAYLWDRSQPVDYPPPPAGEAARGEELWGSVGCSGCHLMDAGAERHDHPRPHRLHGPNLAHLGDKVNAAWLFAWLKDPRRYAPGTLMPDLRLSDREAADLTAFLMASRAPEAPAAELASFREDEVEAGREAIELYGCYGCHPIAGFEDAGAHASAGYSLAGFAGHGMTGLPDFDLSAGEIEAIQAAVSAPPDPPALAAGRGLITRLNCRGCHLIEGAGHAVEATLDDPGLLPPNLRGEGSRVQPDWLAAYLADPASVTLRGWLGVRMPDFGFSTEQIAALLAYFAALGDRELALAPAAAPSPRSLVLGRETFDLMPCGRCHPMSAEAARVPVPGLDLASLAPPLELTRRRLRYEWIGEWLEDPQRWQPGTKMPTFFTRSRSGDLQSPFTGAFHSPLLAEPKERMLEHVASEAELEAFLEDAGAVIAAIRDYVWSLGEAPAEP